MSTTTENTDHDFHVVFPGSFTKLQSQTRHRYQRVDDGAGEEGTMYSLELIARVEDDDARYQNPPEYHGVEPVPGMDGEE